MGTDQGADNSWANLMQGEVVVNTLLALGVQHFFISPGSRSSPLTLAMQNLDTAQYTVILDERVAAFRALGHAKATAKPVALICTSGTAAAHYYPAVIEARETGLPLVVLTADRPPELRSCHAGQTIDQVKLFGSYPVFYTELPLPDMTVLRQVREICRVAVEAAMGIPGGPVHLNCPYREPFFPREGTQPQLDPSLLSGLSPVDKMQGTPVAPIALPERTLILAGPAPATCQPGDTEALLQLSSRYGWPILADAASPLRYHAGNGASVIVHYDRIARDPEIWERLRPDASLHWGEPPTSKELRARLAELDLPGCLVSAGKRAINPSFGKLQWICSNPSDLADACTARAGTYAADWMSEDKRIEDQLQVALRDPHPLFEGDLIRTLETSLPDGAAIVFASSLAIRDGEWFMPASNKRFRPFSQRGANGIDGTISLARGISQALADPTWLVTGDLAFLHDVSALNGVAGADQGLFIILVNNDGGGIFEFLPVAKRCERFEELFATPQPVDPGELVRAYGGNHCLHESPASLDSHIKSWNGRGLEVAELRIDRKRSKALHKRYLTLNTSQDHES